MLEDAARRITRYLRSRGLFDDADETEADALAAPEDDTARALTTDDDGLRWLGRTLIAGGRGSGFVGAGHVVIRSEDERTAELWRKERSSLPQAPSAVKVTPRFGLGGVGVVGVF